MWEFVNDKENKNNAEIFCNNYMDDYYNYQDDLEREVPQNIYEMFDDVNEVCDSYEANEEVRKMDKYCINESALKDKVTEVYEKIVIAFLFITQRGKDTVYLKRVFTNSFSLA